MANQGYLCKIYASTNKEENATNHPRMQDSKDISVGGNNGNHFEDMNVPEVFHRRSNGKLFCKACNISLDSKTGKNKLSFTEHWNSILKQHLSGSLHKFFIQVYNNKSEASILVSEALKIGTLKHFRGGKFFCRACSRSLEYNSLQLLATHLLMVEHQYRVKRGSNEIPTAESDRQALHESLSTEKEKRNVAMEEHFDKLTVLCCTLCLAEVSAPNIEIHVTSAKHRTNIGKCEGGSQNQLEFINMRNLDPNEAIESGVVTKKDVMTFFCNACEKLLPTDGTLNPLKTHLESLNHKSAQSVNRDELKNTIKQEIMDGILTFKFKASEEFSESLDEAAKRKDTLQDADRILNATSQQNTVHQAALRNQDNRHNHGQNRPFEDSIIGSATNPEEERDPEEIIKTSLFVGHIPRTMTEEEVRNLFEPYGQIKDIRIHKNKKGLNRGCCFLDYWNEETASAAKEATDQLDFGSEQKLDVRFAYPPKPKNPPKYTEPHVNRNASASEKSGPKRKRGSRGGKDRHPKKRGPVSPIVQSPANQDINRAFLVDVSTNDGYNRNTHSSYNNQQRAPQPPSKSDTYQQYRTWNESNSLRRDYQPQQRSQGIVETSIAFKGEQRNYDQTSRYSDIHDYQHSDPPSRYSDVHDYQLRDQPSSYSDIRDNQHRDPPSRYSDVHDYQHRDQPSSYSDIHDYQHRDQPSRYSDVHDYQYRESRIQPEHKTERNMERISANATTSPSSYQIMEPAKPFDPYKAVLILGCLCDELGIFGEAVKAICNKALRDRDNIFRTFKEFEVRMTMKIVLDKLKKLSESESDELSRDKYIVGLEKVSLLLHHSLDA